MHVVIYCNWNPTAGGVKTAALELGKALKKKGYKITTCFIDFQASNCSWIALLQYGEIGDVIRILPDSPDIEADVCIIASNHICPPQIKAKKYIQWIHSNYRLYNNLQLVDNPQVSEYVAVSNMCGQVAKEMFNIKPKTIYNLLDPEFAKTYQRPLHLVSATRIGTEKGFHRKLQFAELLEENNIPYTWDIYGESHDKVYENHIKQSFSHLPSVSFRGLILDVRGPVSRADYIVQLSDFEGFCYSLLESLCLGTPAIVTDYPGVEEMITDGVDGYLVPLDMKITKKRLNEIVNKIPKFTYTQKGKVEDWEKLFKKK
jgi:glycosyltransferase involved in cell wall biosynthesis